MHSALLRLANELETTYFETVIRKDTKIEQSQTARMPLIEYADSCKAERDYEAFVNLLLELGGELTWEE